MGLVNLIDGSQPQQIFVAATTTPTVNANRCQTLAVQLTITSSTPSAKTAISGTAAANTLTFPAKTSATGGDYFVIWDPSGTGWAAALNKSGTDPAPTGAHWAAIASGNKVNVDISGTSTAATVATAVKNALNGLTGFTAAVSASDAGNDGTLVCTRVESGPVTATTVNNSNDSGAGSITNGTIVAGVAGKISVGNDTISVTSHGLLTGTKLQVTTTGSRPGGISGGTDYFVVVVDANTFKLSDTLAHAQAGTNIIDITSIGSGTQTFTPTSLAGATGQLQGSFDGTNWYNDGSSQNITSTGVQTYVANSGNTPVYKYYQVTFTITAGQLTVTPYWLGKGPAW